MTRALFAPLVLLALGACAADGTAVNTAATTEPAPVASIETVPVATTPVALATPAPVAVTAAPAVLVTPAPAPATTVAIPATTGVIARAEPVVPIAKQGGGAALAIGASVLGAFIPGPWGSVASVATGQAGRVALDNYKTQGVSYTVRMADNRVETITQDDPAPLAIGTPVEFITLASGSRRLVQSN